MKKRFLAMALSLAMVATTVIAGPTVAKAEKIEGEAYEHTPGTVYSVGDETDTLIDEPIGSTSAFTKASVSGTSKKIVYSIAVTFGTLTYTYDYGYRWNPIKHTYDSTTGGGTAVSAGWKTSDIKDTNCKINVVNNSNYPVELAIGYDYYDPATGYNDSVFNENTNADDAVIGIFTDKLVNFSDSTYAALGYGNDATYVDDVNDPSGKKFYKSVFTYLDVIDASVKTVAGAIYGTIDKASLDAEADKLMYDSAGVTNTTYYFAYSGKPDQTVNFKEIKNVGQITVTVSPMSTQYVEAHNTTWD